MNEPRIRCIASAACWARRDRNPHGSEDEYPEVGQCLRMLSLHLAV